MMKIEKARNDSQKLSKLKKCALVIGTMLLASGFLFGPTILIRGGNIVDAETESTPVFSVRTANAQIQTLKAYFDVNGDIVSTQQVDVFPDVSGRLVSVRVALGTFVRQGDLIAEVEPSRPGAVFMNSPIFAPISGYVSKTPISAGMTVSSNTKITTISTNEAFEISARIPEREIAGLVPGKHAEVSLQAFAG